ncbi:MAG TPA: hypothetical protein VJI96_00645 [Candidatus Andersenbacteria bacterium]|nr:hypothetical protein [Candidatus Andersenbacteria bacterium]
MSIVSIYGSKSLERFTEGILTRGFHENAWEVASDAKNNVYQIHGAPQSEVDDKTIIERLKKDIVKVDSINRVILLHRPDEIQLRFPGLKDVLVSAKKAIGVTFLGDMHINDTFFDIPSLVKKVIPHGFFPISEKPQTDPVIVGSHTTWGEMRSIEHIFRLLDELFKNGTTTIVGYVGGKPKDQLEINILKREWQQLKLKTEVTFLDAHIAEQNLNGKNVILVDSQNIEPANFGLTFNVQLYYLGRRIRTGESSGSVHSSVGIPVILEMNGSEVIENLKTIKIPYGSIEDIHSINFHAGADLILKSIADESYKAMLKHNVEQSKMFNSSYVGREYIKLFNQLALPA